MEGERGSVLYVGGLTLHIRTNWVVGRGPCTRQWLRPPLREHWCGRAATGIKRAPTPLTVTLVHPLSHPSLLPSLPPYYDGLHDTHSTKWIERRRRRRESEGFIFGKRFEGRLLQESELVERRSNLFAIDVVVVKKEREERRNCSVPLVVACADSFAAALWIFVPVFHLTSAAETASASALSDSVCVCYAYILFTAWWRVGKSSAALESR